MRGFFVGVVDAGARGDSESDGCCQGPRQELREQQVSDVLAGDAEIMCMA